jgi:hypothetical protein
LKCAPKKVQKSRQTFRSVGIRADGHVSTCVRFGMRVKPSVIPSVLDAGNSVGICADGHVSDMRALRDVRKSVGDSVGDSVGIVRR